MRVALSRFQFSFLLSLYGCSARLFIILQDSVFFVVVDAFYHIAQHKCTAYLCVYNACLQNVAIDMDINIVTLHETGLTACACRYSEFERINHTLR